MNRSERRPSSSSLAGSPPSAAWSEGVCVCFQLVLEYKREAQNEQLLDEVRGQAAKPSIPSTTPPPPSAPLRSPLEAVLRTGAAFHTRGKTSSEREKRRLVAIATNLENPHKGEISDLNTAAH